MVLYLKREGSGRSEQGHFLLVLRKMAHSAARQQRSSADAAPRLTNCSSRPLSYIGRGHTMSVLRLNVLGPPQVYHDGSRLTFALRKAEALLLYLAVEGGMHPRSKLGALLWPDSEPHAARTALRNALTLLRSLLATPDASASPHSHLLAEQDLLGLDRQAPFELDLDIVQQAYHQAQRHSTFPSQEACRRLMRLYLAPGDATAAGRVYATLRARLAEDLRVKPSAETLTLADQIRASAAASRGSTPARLAAVEGGPPGELVAPLVGRAAAFRQLVGSFQQARGGQAQVVLLVGEAGIGKTRLATEFVAWARAQGAQVLSGQAFELGGRLPYQPLVEALRGRPGGGKPPEEPLGDRWLTRLARLLPELRVRYPDLPVPTQD